MARKAVGRGIAKIAARCMAGGAACNIVALGKREKSMIDAGTTPAKGIHAMAFEAVGRVAGLDVIGIVRA